MSTKGLEREVMTLTQRDDGMWVWLDAPVASILWYAVFSSEEHARLACDLVEVTTPPSPSPPLL